MTTRKPNPAAGKQPATARVRTYTKADGTKVRGHSREADWSTSKKAWVAAGTTGATVAGLLVHATLGTVGVVILVLIAIITGLGAWASKQAAKNTRKTRTNVKAVRGRPGTRSSTRRR